MSRPFQRLRCLMYEYDVSQVELAQRLRLSAHAVSSKMNGHSQWTLDEMYQIMALFGWPVSDMYVLFPHKGRNEEVTKCRRKN